MKQGLLHRAFRLDVVKLSSSVFFSQVISLLCTPIITRLYDPSAFGLYATFSSVFVILNSTSSFRLELAIPIAKSSVQLSALRSVILGLSILSCILVFFSGIIFLLFNPSTRIINLQNIFIVSLAVVLGTANQTLIFGAIKNQNYRILASINVSQALSTNLSRLILFPLGSLGLIVSQLFGFLLPLLQNQNSPSIRPSCSSRQYVYVFRKYRHFVTYSTASGLLNTVSAQIPTLYLAAAFGQAATGSFSMAQSLVMIPSAIIGSSVSNILFGRLSNTSSRSERRIFVARYFRILIFFAAICSCLAFVGASCVKYVLGSEWELSSILIVLLIPMMFGQICVSSLTTVLLVSENNRDDFASQAVSLLLKLFAICYAHSVNYSLNSTVLLLSFASLIGYCLILLPVNKSLNKMLG